MFGHHFPLLWHRHIGTGSSAHLVFLQRGRPSHSHLEGGREEAGESLSHTPSPDSEHVLEGRLWSHQCTMHYVVGLGSDSSPDTISQEKKLWILIGGPPLLFTRVSAL